MRLLLLAWAGLLAPFGAGQEKKSPVPELSAQKETEKLIRDVFKEDYAKKSAPDRIALARKLLDQAVQTKDDPTARYVLLREARDVASQAGDLEVALKAVDRIAAKYEGEIVSMKNAVLVSAGKAAKAPEEFEKLARSFLALVDEASSLELFDVAEKAAEQASFFAKRAKDIPLATKADSRIKQVVDRRVRFEKVRKSREALAANPSDPAANFSVGLYECTVRGNWDTGLPLVAKGSDPVLKGLADKELAPPSSASEEVALADSWWDLSEKEKDPTAKEGLLRHARTWYRHAFPSLTGLLKSKAEKRMGDAILEQIGGSWIDLSDPRNFGLPGKPGDAIELAAPATDAKYAHLDKLPPGEFDAVSVRMRFGADRKANGALDYEKDKKAIYIESKHGRLVLTHKEGEAWINDTEVQIDWKDDFVVTIVLAQGEYVFYLDGVEKFRQKTTFTRLFTMTLEADYATVRFDQFKLRKRE